MWVLTLIRNKMLCDFSVGSYLSIVCLLVWSSQVCLAPAHSYQGCSPFERHRFTLWLLWECRTKVGWVLVSQSDRHTTFLNMQEWGLVLNRLKLDQNVYYSYRFVFSRCSCPKWLSNIFQHFVQWGSGEQQNSKCIIKKVILAPPPVLISCRHSQSGAA